MWTNKMQIVLKYYNAFDAEVKNLFLTNFVRNGKKSFQR